MQQLAVESEDVREQAAAEGDRVSHDRFEHRLGVGPRVRDHAEDLARGAEPIERLRELAVAGRRLAGQVIRVPVGGHGTQHRVWDLRCAGPDGKPERATLARPRRRSAEEPRIDLAA